MTTITAHESLPEPPGLDFVVPSELVPEPTQSPEVASSDELLCTEAAHSALLSYSEQVNSPRAYEHPLRVATILHDFVGTMITRDVYDAAALHDIAQHIEPGHPEQEAAASTLHSYIARVDPDTWKYKSTLLADMQQIEICSQQVRCMGTGAEDPVVAALLTPKYAIGPELERTPDLEVPTYAWSISSGLVDLHDIEGLLQNVNLESVLVKAAEMLDNLRHPAPTDRALLQDIFDAETFYAPLCEAIGFDGLSMALRNAAAVNRLQKSRQVETLTKAQDMLASLGDHDQVLKDVTGVFKHLLGSSVKVATPLEDKSNHGIMLGHSNRRNHRLNGDSIASEVRWRVKTLGSLALKLAKRKPSELNPDEIERTPADVLGITIIVDDQKALNMTYRGLVECIKRNTVVKESPAPGCDEAFSIQGSKDYIEAVQGAFAESDFVASDEFEVVEKNNGHQVVKATFLYMPPNRANTVLPVELQIQTKEDWEISRTGSAAHLLYKAGIFDGHEVLAAIRKRREHLGSGALNPASELRGTIFRSRFDLAA